MIDYHPVINLIYFCIVMGVGMSMNNPSVLAIGFAAAFTYASLLNGLVHTLKYVLKFIVPMMLIVVIINPLVNHYGATILFYFSNGNAVTLEAIVYGIAIAAMLAIILLWFQCFNKVMTSDKLIYLFGGISPKLALMFSMVLKLVPDIIARFKLVKATMQPKGKLFERIRQGVKCLSIVITWSLESSVQTADSMKARQYGARKRSTFSIYEWQIRDVALGLIMLFAALNIICGASSVSAQYNPIISLSEFNLEYAITVVSFLIVSFLPVFIKLKEALQWKQLYK